MAGMNNASIFCENLVASIGSTSTKEISNCYEPVRSYCPREKVDHGIEKIQKGKPKILHGTIGTGKTYAARHYIDVNKTTFGIKWFLNVSTSEDSIISSLNDLAEKLGVQYRQLFDTIEERAKYDNIIFVLDNVEKKPPSEWFKKLWNIRRLLNIIITTNNASLFLSLSGAEELQVEKFDEAMAFLQGIHPNNSEEDLKELCNHFGWNILGLTTAKDYMLIKKMTARTYLKMLRDREAAPKIRQNELGRHNRTLYASVRACLEDVDKDKFSVLASVSFISNDMIPEFLLSNQIPSGTHLAKKADLDNLHDQLKSLVHITEENGIRFFSFHSFTQYVIKDMIDEPVKADLSYKLVEIFVRYINKDNRFSKDNFLQRHTREHAELVIQEWEDKEKDDRTAIALARLSELVGFIYSQEQPPLRRQSDVHFARARELIHNLCGITKDDLKPADGSVVVRRSLHVDQMYGITEEELKVSHRLFEKLTRKSSELSPDIIQELVFWRTVNKQDMVVFPKAVKENQMVKEKIESSQPLSSNEVKVLVDHKVAYSVDDYRKLFLPELYLSVIFTFGRNYFYRNGDAIEQPTSYIHLLKLAYCLSREISEAMNENDAVFQEYSAQSNGLLYLLVNDDYICRDDIHKKKEEQVHAKDLVNAIDRYKQLEREERRFFEMGILKTTGVDTYGRLVCHRQILTCYKALLSINSIEDRADYVKDGVQICDDLLKLLDTFTAQNALVQNSRYLNTIGEFYLSINKDEYYLKAIDIFTKSAEKAKEDQVTLFHLEALVGLAEVYSRMGNRDHSLAYLTECEDKESLRSMKQQKPRIQQRMKKIQEQNIAMVAKAKQKPASHDERSDGDYHPCNENEYAMSFSAIIAVAPSSRIEITITADGVEVVKDVGRTVGKIGLSLGALYAGYSFLTPLIDRAVEKAFGGEYDDSDVRDIRPGDLPVVLNCPTKEGFKEAVTDYESGVMKERLLEELSNVGIKTRGLEVKIDHMVNMDDPKGAIKLRIAVGKEGGCFRISVAGAFLIFPPETFDKKETLDVSRVRYNESEVQPKDGGVFVSRILKIEPKGVTFKKPVTVLLSHSAYEDQIFLDFYELFVGRLNPTGWQELETKRISSIEDVPIQMRIPEIFDDFSPFAKATIQETCTLVAVTRIRCETIHIPTNRGYTFCAAYGKSAVLKITFPAGVTRDILCLKVQLFPVDTIVNKDAYLEQNLVCGPVVRVSGQKDGHTFLKPVEVELTYSHCDVANIDENVLPFGTKTKMTTMCGFLLHKHQVTDSELLCKILNETNDVFIERRKKDQLTFFFSVEHFSDFQPVVTTIKPESYVPPMSISNATTNINVQRYNAVVLAVHKTGGIPTTLHAILAPRDALKNVKEKWNVKNEYRKFEKPLRFDEKVYFCVPQLNVSQLDHLPLENHTLRFDPDPELESELHNKTEEGINLKGKDMRFLQKECDDGKNHSTQEDCRAVVPIHISSISSVQDINEHVSVTSPTLAPRQGNGENGASYTPNDAPTAQNENLEEYLRDVKYFEEQIEIIFLKKLGINKEDIHNPSNGITAKTLTDIGAVSSIALGVAGGVTIILGIGTFGATPLAIAAITAVTFTVSKIEQNSKKSNATKLNEKVEIYFHSHLKSIIMDVARELSRMFECQVVELENHTQINALAECAVNLMLDLKKQDEFDRNTLLKKVLKEGKVGKRYSVTTKNKHKRSALDIFRKPGLRKMNFGTKSTSFLYFVKKNGDCDTKTFGYRGEFLECENYEDNNEENEHEAQGRIHANQNDYQNSSCQYFCESFIDSEYTESQEENSHYFPIRILVQCPKILDSFRSTLPDQRSLASFLKKMLNFPQNHIVHPVYRQHTPGRVPDLKEADLTGSDFSHSNFSNSSLEKCDIVNCVMLFANLAKAKITGSKFIDTLISHSNLAGVQADHCQWTKTSLLYSSVDNANFVNVVSSISGNCLNGTNISDAITG